MAGFRVDNFSGIRPRASDVRLEGSEAVTALDVDLRRGLLRPRTKQLTWVDGVDPSIPTSSVDSPQTLFRFRRRSDDTDFWMYFTQDVNIVPGPAESEQQRHYYTGDGEPRMFTADSIDDTTPPYPEAADTKYPFTWFKLGVPAPASAPVLDVEALPEPSEGSVGLITEVTAENLIVTINGPLQNTTGFNPGACGEDGRNAGLNTANMQPQGGSQQLTCLKPGTRVRVTAIVDADHVTVVAAGRTGPIEDMGLIPDSTNWSWDNALPEVHKHKWLTRLNSTAKRKSFFLLPSEVTLTVENHILRVGDIIRITGSAAPMSVTITQDLVTTPVTTNVWNNWGFRTATLDTTNDVVFSGTTSFLIERDGSSIDPVVPASEDFEIEARAYVYTYVSALGEESAPSPPSEIVTIRVGDEVPITTFAPPPTEHRNIDRIWIYRTNTGSEDTAFQFVGELAVANIASGFTDDVPNEELGEVLETEGWDVPDENMIGLVAMPNGIMAGFFDNVLCFSEPGFPHAWPSDYRIALDFDVVGMEVYGNALYVTTKGKPYIVVGVHPRQMSARHVDTIQSCIDKRSIVKSDDSVLYCSFEGLISAGAGFINVTDKHYTKEQWQKIVGPDNAEARSVRAWYFDSQYIMLASYSDGVTTVTTKLVFDFRDSREPRVTAFSENIQAAYADPELAQLYFISNDFVDTPTIPTLMAVSLDATTQSIMTSADGITWTSQTTPVARAWRGVAYSPSLERFVAVSTSTIARSDDGGVTWNEVLVTGAWRDIAWSPALNLFVAVGDNGSGSSIISTSPDGITWTPRTPVAGTGRYWSVMWDDRTARFYATSQSGTQRISVSSNGTTWSFVTSGPTDTGPGVIVTDGSTLMYTSPGIIECLTSTDGLIWTANQLVPAAGTADRASAGKPTGRFVNANSFQDLRYSLDSGVTWAESTALQKPAGTLRPSATVYSEALGLFMHFLDAGSSFPGAVLTSPDGITWTLRTVPSTAQKTWIKAVAVPDPQVTRRLFRWNHEHPSADVATQFSSGDYITGEFRLPRPMAFSCARAQCRRVPTASGTMNAHAQLQITVKGRRYDAWGTAATPIEDDLLLKQATVIDGQPGAGGWAGEQRSAPFRIDVNTLVDAVRFEIHAEGPVELETIQLGESMEDLEPS